MNEQNLQDLFRSARQDASASKTLTDAVMHRVDPAPDATLAAVLCAVAQNFVWAFAVLLVCAAIGSLLTQAAGEMTAAMHPDFPPAGLLSQRSGIGDVSLEPDVVAVFDMKPSFSFLEILARAVLPLSFHLLAAWFLLSTVGISVPANDRLEQRSAV